MEEKFKHYYEKAKALFEKYPYLGAGVIGAIFVLIYWIFTRNSTSSSENIGSAEMEYSNPGVAGVGGYSIPNPVTSSGSVLTPGTVGTTATIPTIPQYFYDNGGSSAFSGLSGFGSENNFDAFSLGYNADSAFDGSLGYKTNPTGSRAINTAINMVGLGPVAKIANLFGYNIGNELTKTDNMKYANKGLDRTGVFAENFGGLPGGVSEKQAIDAYNKAMDFNKSYYGDENVSSKEESVNSPTATTPNDDDDTVDQEYENLRDDSWDNVWDNDDRDWDNDSDDDGGW